MAVASRGVGWVVTPAQVATSSRTVAAGGVGVMATLPSVDRFCAPGDVRDHVRVVDVVQLLPVARVEEIVAVCHEREQVLGPACRLACRGHEGSFRWLQHDDGVPWLPMRHMNVWYVR